jgi:hypothetical protein
VKHGRNVHKRIEKLERTIPRVSHRERPMDIYDRAASSMSWEDLRLLRGICRRHYATPGCDHAYTPPEFAALARWGTAYNAALAPGITARVPA